MGQRHTTRNSRLAKGLNQLYRRLRFEPLEDRRLLTITVNTLADGIGVPGTSLREAIAAATPGETINFSVTGTINISAGEMLINKSLVIDGPGANQLTIDAQLASRVFDIAAGSNTVVIDGVTLTRGQAVASQNGGAIRSQSTGLLTIRDSMITDSRAGSGTTGIGGSGGGIWGSGPLTVIGSTISGNRSGNGGVSANGDFGFNAGSGGGIRSSGTLTVTNSTISGNTAGVGGEGGLSQGNNGTGGGISSAGTATVSHSTITANLSTSTSGAGISVASGSATISHTIVALNRHSASTRSDISGNVSASFSLIGDNTGATITDNGGNIIGTGAPIDPLLGTLDNNGGPTRTHALLIGSLAINTGDPAAAGAPLFDQRGTPHFRVVGGQIDMGAYESAFQGPHGLVVDTTSDVVNGNYSAGNFSLREAISIANTVAGAHTITFAAAMSGATITLGGTELAITEALTIDAAALAQNVTINANQFSRVINITAATGDFTLAGLTLIGGRTTGSDVPGSDLYRGGAIRSRTSGNLTLQNATVSGNSTVGDIAHGGGISARFLTLTQSTVSGNSTAGDSATGGGIYASNVTLIQSTVSGNSTFGDAAYGGGIRAGYVTLTQSTVSGNSTAGQAAHGGGIWVFLNIALSKSTITDNHVREVNATATGDGVFQENSLFSMPFTISDSIVAGNTGENGSAGADLVKDPEGTLTLIYSVIGFLPPEGAGGILSFGSLTKVPAMLAPLADNGGPTQTHMPLPGSPAMNNGNPMFNPADPDGNPATNDAMPYDQRGAPYVRLSGGRIDIGAVEFQPPPGPSLPGDYNLNGEVEAADYVIWRKTLNSNVTPFSGADGNGDSVVNQSDCGVWHTHFRETLGTGAGQLAQSAEAEAEKPAATRSDELLSFISPSQAYGQSRSAVEERVVTTSQDRGDDALFAWLDSHIETRKIDIEASIFANDEVTDEVTDSAFEDFDLAVDAPVLGR